MSRFADQIDRTAPHRATMQTPRMKVPVVFHISSELMPGDATLEQLESVCSNGCLYHHVAAMADVHSKPGRKNATGTTIASTTSVLPQVNDSDPACGMRLVRTNMNESNTTPEEIEKLFQALTLTVPTKKFWGTYIPFWTVVDICRNGVSALIKYLNIQTKYEEENSLDRGNFFETAPSRWDILSIIPGLFIFFAQFRLGILGAAGNHFLDLMKVTEIMDESTATKLGLKSGDYVFMVHCGSGILGQYTMYSYTAKRREHLSQAIMVTVGKLLFWTKNRKSFNKIQEIIRESGNGRAEPLIQYQGAEADLYMQARNACSNFAHANRATITHNVSETIKRVLDRDPQLELLYDMPHILVTRESHYGSETWVHRNGTSRAYGPARMASHPLFRETGEPAFVPSSLSTEAYLCVGTDSNESSFYSSNHGCGKATVASDSVVPKSKEELHQKLATQGVKLYNGKSSKVIEQDSSQYKKIDEVMAGIVANQITKPVAKMQPVSVIMY